MSEQAQCHLKAAGKPYPRTCPVCKLGPCKYAALLPVEEKELARQGEKTLLDEYAMAALTGILSVNTADRPLPSDMAAIRAYDYAEALLTERQKREGR